MKCKEREKFCPGIDFGQEWGLSLEQLEPACHVQITATGPERKRITALTLASPQRKEHSPLPLVVFGNSFH